MPSNPEFGVPPIEIKPNLFPQPQTQVIQGLGQTAIQGAQVTQGLGQTAIQGAQQR